LHRFLNGAVFLIFRLIFLRVVRERSSSMKYAEYIYLFPVLVSLFFSGCLIDWGEDEDFNREVSSYRKDMRDFVVEIGSKAKLEDPDFIIVPQNGHELLSLNGAADGASAGEYLSAIDGVGREELFYGYEEDNLETSNDIREEMLPFLEKVTNAGKTVLVTDYASDKDKIETSCAASEALGFVGFASPSRDLDGIPAFPKTPHNVNNDKIDSLKQISNFLYLIDPAGFEGTDEYLEALQSTDFDLLIIDAFGPDGEALTLEQVESLKIKSSSGAKRMVLAYMSIGEAESYRWYFDEEWKTDPPAFLHEENLDWAGNYKVEYWNEDWKSIIYSGEDSYLQYLLDAGFDGAYLDIIDAYEYFEEQDNSSSEDSEDNEIISKSW